MRAIIDRILLLFISGVMAACRRDAEPPPVFPRNPAFESFRYDSPGALDAAPPPNDAAGYPSVAALPTVPPAPMPTTGTPTMGPYTTTTAVHNVARPPSFSGLTAGNPRPDSYALVIGVEKYRDIQEVPIGASSDAVAFAEVAKATMGVPPANLFLLIDGKALKSDIEERVDWLANNVERGSIVYFFFAGHGTPNDQGSPYLVAWDGNIAQSIAGQKKGALSLRQIIDKLAASKAERVIAFVDACYSGSGRSVRAQDTRASVVRDISQDGRLTSKVAIYAAARANQVSGPTVDRKAGLFTSTVVEALGKALADVDGDGSVSLGELDQWVTPRVAREASRLSRQQEPDLKLGPGLSAQNVLVATGLKKH